MASHVRAVALLIALSAVPSVLAADFCPAPPLPTPRSAAIPAGDHRIHIDSDAATLAADGKALVNGRVMVTENARQVTADSVTYDPRTGRVTVKGKVRFEDPRLRIQSDAGSYDQSGGAEFGDAAFKLLNRNGRGFAKQIEVKPGGKITLHRVRYTACPVGNEDWALRASSIDLDTARQQGAAHGAHLLFKGVPLFYTPYLSFPLGSARQSGFLYPNFAHSGNTGYSIGIPYYFNLAPNYDLTLTPGYMSARGADIAGQYRYLTTSSHGQIDTSFLPEDLQTQAERNYFRATDVTELDRRSRVGFDIASVSDSNYFQDFAVGSAETSVTYLQRRAEYLYHDDAWRVSAQLQNFQTIDISVAAIDRPYSRVPRVTADALWPIARTGLEFSLDSEAVNFLRDVGPTGIRLNLAPELRWARRAPGYFFVPAIGWNFTQYDLQNAGASLPSSPTRSLPYGRLDMGLVFERDTGAGGGRTQTLEPRVVYSYIPYRNQNDLPVFDTALPDLNLTELYRTNRYVGGDRIGDANQLSLGVTTRLFDHQSGQQYLSATLGQTRYFSQPRVTLPGETPVNYGASNIVGELAVTAYRNWSVKMNYQWNPYVNTTEKSEVSVQYRPDAARMVNLGYRFQHGVLDQWDGSAAWPIAAHWNAVGRLVYSTLDRKAIEQVAGFEYTSCCWRVQVVQRRYVVNRTGAMDTSIAVQLELLGLSSVGGSADTFLRRSISGYSAVNPVP
ncbi:MAG TPA: LPS assembly protein LptD [Steroidobacteraceae bacterium]|nr:LPS assembly protein LptD [Steroidobacteraceae bacterium]